MSSAKISVEDQTKLIVESTASLNIDSSLNQENVRDSKELPDARNLKSGKFSVHVYKDSLMQSINNLDENPFNH